MPTMLQLPTLAKYLYGVLTSGAAGAVVATYFGARVYRGSLAPQGAALPYLLFFAQAAEDDYCLPSSWQGTEATYFVKGVAAAGAYQSVLLPGMAAVDAALQGKILAGTTQDGFTVAIEGSSQPREYEEVLPGGAVVIHLGRSWQLSVEPS